MTQTIGDIVAVLNTPTGVLFMGVMIIVTGYMGKWRFEREVKERDITILHQRALINRLAGVQETNNDVTRTAIEVARRQLGADI